MLAKFTYSSTSKLVKFNKKRVFFNANYQHVWKIFFKMFSTEILLLSPCSWYLAVWFWNNGGICLNPSCCTCSLSLRSLLYYNWLCAFYICCSPKLTLEFVKQCKVDVRHASYRHSFNLKTSTSRKEKWPCDQLKSFSNSSKRYVWAYLLATSGQPVLESGLAADLA